MANEKISQLPGTVALNGSEQFEIVQNGRSQKAAIGLVMVANVNVNVQNPNVVFAGPTSGAAAAPSFRNLVGADLPLPTAGSLGGVESHAAVTHQFLTSINTDGTSTGAQPTFPDISGTLGVSQGGTGANTLTQHGVLLGEGTGTVVATAAMTAAQILVGQASADPSPQTMSGDATLAANAALTIANNAVTNAKLAQAAGNTIKGNATGSLANVSDLTVLPTAVFPALTGDVTTSAGSVATTIGANKVTRAMLAQGVARSVVGVTGNATANEADITGTANQVLVQNAAGTALAFGQVNLASSAAVTGALPVANGGTGVITLTAHGILIGEGTGNVVAATAMTAGQILVGQGATSDPTPQSVSTDATLAANGALTIANNAVSNAKFRQSGALSVVGNVTNATANVADITAASDGQVLRRSGTAIAFGAVDLTNASAVTGALGTANAGIGSAALAAALANYLTKQAVTASTASLSINMNLGWVVELTLSAGVTSVAVTNWPASGTLGRLVLNIASTGAFNITGWPGTTIWPAGTPPTITSGTGKKDTIMLTSDDGGTTFRGFVPGQNLS